ncbi:MAG TPA: hypothetical protein VMV31_15350 [Terriglobales bacterium]|nr:hypothetical protein [Terriglobales bacterium]
MAPADEYSRRLDLQRQRAAAAQRRDLALGVAKLAGVFLLLVLAWLALLRHAFAWPWLALPLAALAALFLGHDRALRARRRAQRLAAYYQRGLDRLHDRWSGSSAPGAAGERFRDPAHPYADDLDLFGRGGLFELLSTARTALGEDRLAAWMLAPAPPPELRRRQAQVEALRHRLDLREQVAALGDALEHSLHPARLRSWALTPPRLTHPLARAAAAALGLVAAAAAVYGLGTGQLGPFFLLVILQALLLARLRPRLQLALADRGANGEGLRLFAGVLALIPGEVASPSSRMVAVAALRRLANLADWIEASATTLGRILDFTLLYSLQLAFAADAWRRRYGAQVPAWLDAVAEFEALLSLSSFAYERPDQPFPEWLDAPLPHFQGEELGHPLLPRAACVCNSVTLGGPVRLWLVSGSNMSGKSTLLRTVGLNAVLAQMGAPVCARSLRMTPLALGTRLRTADSLQLGRSGFYAEILRLRQVFDLTRGPLPVLFLFDELLEGTNSHDRVLGARGLLRALLALPTLGLVTTHDLALTALADAFDGCARNVHFEDQIEGQNVRFDHRLRDGVVSKSNALALMRLIGLEV